jgi:hypothetical protein
MKVLAGQNKLTDAESEQLDGLTEQAVKLEKQITVLDQIAKDEADSAADREREKAEAVKAAREEERAKAAAAAGRLSYGEAPYQAEFSPLWKYDNLTPGELSMVMSVMQSAGKAVSSDAFKALSLKIAEMKDDNSDEDRKAVGYIKSAFKAATGIDPIAQAVAGAIKAATDPMYTGGSLVGLDWVGTAYSTDLWKLIRARTLVADKIPAEVIPDGYSSKTWPLESTDPTWYKIAEATASEATLKVPAATVTASQAATASKNIPVGKLGARVLYTGELTEDSLVVFVPQLREQLQVSGSEILESLMIDGDVETSASKNINAIDTTPAATDYFLVADGFRKLPLITTTANSRSAGGALVIEDYIDTMKLMGTAGLAGSDPSKVAFIVDGNVHYANMKLPEVKTQDVYGSAATVESGFLTQAFGVKIFPSWQMHRASAKRMANTAGKIDGDTDANNTTGAIVAVRFDQWKQAYKRRMTLETTRIANADSWEIVALIRWGMAYRDGEASAVTYNVGI